VANAVLVLLFAVLALGSSGSAVNHTEVRPWGCRTCPIPAPAPAGAPGEGTGGGTGRGAGMDADSDSAL
jgi:hypothetical protein